MGQGTKKKDKCQDPKIRFSAALETLGSYTEKKSNEPLLFKIINFAKNFIQINFFKKQKTAYIGTEEYALQQALDDVIRFLPIIQQNNSEEAQRLSARALDTIHLCTRISKEKNNSGLHNRLQRFLLKKTPIDSFKTNKIFSFFDQQKSENAITGKITDIFRMQAITLMNSHSKLFSTSRHTFNTIRETPIYSITAPEENKEGVSHFTLEQRLSPFPGETVILRGSFKHDPAVNTTPMPNSFDLTHESIQTGFPYPPQHTGFALADPIIPPHPMRPQYFKSLSDLLEKKEAVADAFLKRTALLEKSRILWQEKLECSQNHKEEFLSLHSILSKAIVGASSRKHLTQETEEILSRFFSWLEMQTIPYTALSTVYRHINIWYIQEPHTFLLENWLNQTDKQLFIGNAKERFEAARRLVLERIDLADDKISGVENESSVTGYIRLLGRIIGKGSTNIFLQYFSEVLECPPPQLSDFERQLQTAAITQQETFFSELEETSKFSFLELKKALEEDISIFQSLRKFHPFCHSLEKYYVSRYTRSP